MEELLSGQSGSEPQIRVSLDGPYVVTNVREFRNWLGEALSATQAMELCRCGQSSNKPFCNGSHSKAKGSGAKDPNRVPDKRDEYDGVGVQISAIAPTHARALRAEDTDWKAIVSLYDRLMTLRPSPRPSAVVGLNRAIAISLHEGPKRGLEEINRIADRDRLTTYPFYFAALGELEHRLGRYEVAREHFRAALVLARNPMERRFLSQRVDVCEPRETE
jgi:CDGSH-type Zn-finger protein